MSKTREHVQKCPCSTMSGRILAPLSVLRILISFDELTDDFFSFSCRQTPRLADPYRARRPVVPVIPGDPLSCRCFSVSPTRVTRASVPVSMHRKRVTSRYSLPSIATQHNTVANCYGIIRPAAPSTRSFSMRATLLFISKIQLSIITVMDSKTIHRLFVRCFLTAL